MSKYDTNTQMLITRNLSIDKWVHVMPNGSHISLGYPASEKAGDIAKTVARMTGKQIGILSEVFGPACKALYGEIVWFKKGFEQ